MSLFGNEREANLESTAAMVEDVLIRLGHFVNDCRSPRPGSAQSWTISNGSAPIAIDLIDHPDYWRVRMSAVIMTIDDKVDKLALYERLLALNAVEVTGAAFALQGREVLLLSERSTLGLDHRELQELLALVRLFASEYDAKLVERYGGTLGSTATGPPQGHSR